MKMICCHSIEKKLTPFQLVPLWVYLAVFLLGGLNVFSQESCSRPNVTVQYKTALAALSKDCFVNTEYTNQDLPRIHVYHVEQTQQNYDEISSTAFTLTTNYVENYICGTLSAGTRWYAPGSYLNTNFFGGTATEWNSQRGVTNCSSSNFFIGNWLEYQNLSDTRQVADRSCVDYYTCHDYIFSLRIEPLALVRTNYMGTDQWCWVGNNWSTNLARWCSDTGETNGANPEWLFPSGGTLPDHDVGLACTTALLLTPTHAV
jgi:hypothetical protein